LENGEIDSKERDNHVEKLEDDEFISYAEIFICDGFELIPL